MMKISVAMDKDVDENKEKALDINEFPVSIN